MIKTKKEYVFLLAVIVISSVILVYTISRLIVNYLNIMAGRDIFLQIQNKDIDIMVLFLFFTIIIIPLLAVIMLMGINLTIRRRLKQLLTH